MSGPPPWPGDQQEPPYQQQPLYQQQPPYQQPHQYGQQPYQHGQPYPYPPTSSGQATASLVLGILGLVFCPVLPSIAALITGYGARKEIDASQGHIGGRGNATAGIVMGWIGIVFWTLVGIAGVVLLLAAAEDIENYEDGDYYNEVSRATLAFAARSAGFA